MKSSAWFAHWKPDAYALGPFRFEKPVNEREARAYIRKWAGVKTLHGWAVWPTK